MSTIELQRAQGRGGLLSCACDPLMMPDSVDAAPVTRWPLTIFTLSNAVTIFAQALVLTIVPVGGAVLGSGVTVALPFAALLLGAAVGTVPAAWLTGVDQRWGFALGATFGVAGAALGAFGIVAGLFGAFVLGSFWLGLAQGFGNFYRHGAAGLGRRDARAIALVFGSGVAAAFAVPGALTAASALAGPFATAATLVIAALAHFFASALAFFLPRQRGFVVPGDTGPVPHYAFATITGALSWGAMALMMGLAPSLMLGCGIGLSQTSGTVAWHIVAMYAPALLLGFVITPKRAPLACLTGLALSAGAIGLAFVAQTQALFTCALIMSGIGWSATTLGATTLLHAQANPTRAQLALHDFMLLAAALAGSAAVALA